MAELAKRLEKRVLRFIILVNDDIQQFPEGKIVHARADRQGSQNIELWIECTVASNFPDGEVHGKQLLRVFGTGHVISLATSEHKFTIEDAPFMWHIYRVFETN